jgi:type I restriction enzyme R subunit
LGTTKLECETRKETIGEKLKGLSQPWEIVRYREGLDASRLICYAVDEFPTVNGPAEYVLFVKGKLLGIIEGRI